MAKKVHDIRSTEKLLELIRNQNNPETDENPSSETVKIAKSGKVALFPSSFKKRTVIGVDIGHTHVRLAKIIRTDKSAELVDYLDVPFNTSFTIKDETFLNALKTALDQFSQGLSQFELWGAIQSGNVETRCIRIPKLPRKQIPNAIYWTFTKKTPFDKNIEILDFEIIGDITEGGVKKTEVLAFKAPKAEVAAFKEAFQKIGYPLQGISIVPFAIQNLFRSSVIAQPDEDTCCLFVGRDWSRIAIFNSGNLVLSRGIKAGMRSMIEAINSTIMKQEDLSKGIEASDAGPGGGNASAAIHPKAQQLFFDLLGVAARQSKKPSDSGEMIHNQVFQMVLPAMERLIRQIERTFEHYTLNFNTDGVKRIFISGQIVANAKVVQYFEKQLEMPAVPLNPFPSGTPFTQQIRIPEGVSEREGYVPAIGLALSSNAITPNFLFTHQDKDVVENARKNNMRIFTACMVCLLVMFGIFSWQQKKLDQQRGRAEALSNQLIKYNPPAKKELLLALFAKAKQNHQLVSKVVRRYAPAAVITELAEITPANIRLLNINASFADESANPPKPQENSVVIEGIIFGDAGNFETMLTSYLLNLKSSPLFRKPNVQSKQVEFYSDQEVMRFITRLEFI